jgi:mRNA interferase MazF
MTTIRAGDFWIAEITFTSGVSSKKRPVLILWCDGDDVIVAVVTSAQPRSQTDIPLKHWQESGLKIPSTVRLSRLDSLEKSILLTKIGHISATDAENILNVWISFVKPQF